MSPLDTGNRWCALGVAVFAIGVLGLAVEAAPALAMINESPSLPRGLYVRVPGADVRRGVTVAAPQPKAARAYLETLGMPPDTALIKRVAAVGGDAVCLQGDRIRLPDGLRPVRRVDRRGVPLPRWSGCRRLAAGEIFLIGDTTGSFDSRYFGPVDRSELLGVYREMATW